jgi:hypothetical protein
MSMTLRHRSGLGLDERHGLVPAGVVDQHVDPALRLGDGGDHGGDRRAVGDVHGICNVALPPISPATASAAAPSTIGDDDDGALGGALDGDGAADAGTGTGDDGDLVRRVVPWEKPFRRVLCDLVDAGGGSVRARNRGRADVGR